jgi:hypothetical protein
MPARADVGSRSGRCLVQNLYLSQGRHTGPDRLP